MLLRKKKKGGGSGGGGGGGEKPGFQNTERLGMVTFRVRLLAYVTISLHG
jgi:hypothetical protein